MVNGKWRMVCRGDETLFGCKIQNMISVNFGHGVFDFRGVKGDNIFLEISRKLFSWTDAKIFR